MGMNVHDAPVVPVHMKMHFSPRDAAQYVESEQHEHHANRELERHRKPRRNRRIERHRNSGEEQQCTGVTDTPDDALQYGLRDGPAVCCERRHGSDMIGLERMLHAEQQPEHEQRRVSVRLRQRRFHPAGRGRSATTRTRRPRRLPCAPKAAALRRAD